MSEPCITTPVIPEQHNKFGASCIFFLLRLYLLFVDYLALLMLNSTAYLSYWIQSNSKVLQWFFGCFHLLSSVNCHLRPLSFPNSLPALLLLKVNECIFHSNFADHSLPKWDTYSYLLFPSCRSGISLSGLSLSHDSFLSLRMFGPFFKHLKYFFLPIFLPGLYILVPADSHVNSFY